MKNILIVLLSILFLACDNQTTISNSQDSTTPSYEAVSTTAETEQGEIIVHDEEIEQFLIDFEEVVRNNDIDGMINLMDENYAREQLTIFLNGDKQQFVDEFFCGHNTETGGFMCVEFNRIVQFYRATDYEDFGDYFYITYFVKSEKDTMESGVMIQKQEKDGKVILSLIGAVG